MELLERLVRLLLAERADGADMEVPAVAMEQRRLLRALLNVRPPLPASAELIACQDAYLQARARGRGVTDGEALPERLPHISLWRGDITTLRCDAIVNAANEALLGCFCPNHGCIDNAIHTFAGLQLRLACQQLMQGRMEPTGRARLTPAFNLPCRYVLHTVGPIVQGEATARDERLLRACYQACLDAADAAGLRSLAFCCISTGEFHFPNQLAAEIATSAVRTHPAVQQGRIKVIFDVFQEQDERIYERLLV